MRASLTRNIPDRRGRAGDDVEHARRHAGFLAQQRQRQRAEGVSSDGFSTIVQPAASAGATLRVIIAAGKFHGVTAATTPTARRSTQRRVLRVWPGIMSP